jgi:glycosyltransferase involved in cell wall biosynthesis
MKKVLFLVPHLSTGGMPQYTYDLMRKIKNDVVVYCVEYSMVSPHFVVQRNKIINLIGDNFFCLGENKEELFKLIEDISPDIIHLQEVPEYFLDGEIATKLYSPNRNYLIVETSHDSSFPASSKRFNPDHFALISQYQKNEFSKLGIPISFIEADIEYKERQDRETGLKKLGLDPSLKHVLNVGLFTPRKNQAEAIEYARLLENYPIQFHFVGNQADNFADYWKPLLQNLPSNVKIWGERSDVDDFYSCMDLMLFTSRGTGNDKIGRAHV